MFKKINKLWLQIDTISKTVFLYKRNFCKSKSSFATINVSKTLDILKIWLKELTLKHIHFFIYVTYSNPGFQTGQLKYVGG